MITKNSLNVLLTQHKYIILIFTYKVLYYVYFL